MYATLSRFIRDDSGATALEYGLIAGLIATVMVTATKTLGGKLTNTFTNRRQQAVAATSAVHAPGCCR